MENVCYRYRVTYLNFSGEPCELIVSAPSCVAAVEAVALVEEDFDRFLCVTRVPFSPGVPHA